MSDIEKIGKVLQKAGIDNYTICSDFVFINGYFIIFWNGKTANLINYNWLPRGFGKLAKEIKKLNIQQTRRKQNEKI